MFNENEVLLVQDELRIMLRYRLANQFAVLVVQRRLRAQEARAFLTAAQVGRMARGAIRLVQPLAVRYHGGVARLALLLRKIGRGLSPGANRGRHEEERGHE